MGDGLIRLALCVVTAGLFCLVHVVFIWCVPQRSRSLHRGPAALGRGDQGWTCSQSPFPNYSNVDPIRILLLWSQDPALHPAQPLAYCFVQEAANCRRKGLRCAHTQVGSSRAPASSWPCCRALRSPAGSSGQQSTEQEQRAPCGPSGAWERRAGGTYICSRCWCCWGVCSSTANHLEEVKAHRV